MDTYIAVCDDNMGDRKQMERLLGRESDARLNATGILYIDSFGSEDALLKTPMKYDLFFIDLCNGTRDGMDAAATLRAEGVVSPIVLCSSKINYPGKYGNVAGYHYMDKPIRKQELSDMIDFSIREKLKRAPLIELRDEQTKSTYFVTSNEILYTKSSGRSILTALTNDRNVYSYGTMDSLRIALCQYANFLNIGNHTIINMDYIKKRSGRTFEMMDGTVFSFHLFEQKRIMNAFLKYRQNIVS